MSIPKAILTLLILNLLGVTVLMMTLWVRKIDTRHALAGTGTLVQTNDVWVTNTVAVAATNALRWSDLESEDYSDYIKNLRGIGCPDQTIRDIIIADLDLLWAPRIHSLRPRRGVLNYWESEELELRNDFDQRQWQREERSIDREKRGVIRELIGVDLSGERLKLGGKEDPINRRLKFLSEDKQMNVRDAVDRFREEEWAILEKQWEEGTALTSEDREALRALRKKQETALAEILTAEERTQYDLWMSSTAETVRHDFYGMNATEQEFRAVYELRKAFDDQWVQNEIDFNDPQSTTAWHEARHAMDQQIQEVLGEERHQDYQRGQDEDFHLLNRTISRYGLNRDTAGEIYEFKRVLEREKQRLVLDSDLSLNQKEAALSAMTDEARVAVKETLGENAYNYFRRKTSWLSR